MKQATSILFKTLALAVVIHFAKAEIVNTSTVKNLIVSANYSKTTDLSPI